MKERKQSKIYLQFSETEFLYFCGKRRAMDGEQIIREVHM